MSFIRFSFAAFLLTLCALVFFVLGYVAGEQESSAQTFRDCVYLNKAELPSGGSINCQLRSLGDNAPPLATTPPPASAPAIPAHKRREKLWPPVGFDKIDRG